MLPPSSIDRVVRIGKRLWAAPCTLAGLCLFAPALLFGGRARCVHGCIEIALAHGPRSTGWTRRWVRRLPFHAITFGHLVAGIDAGELDRLRSHEHAHVAQYERWGALFLLAYPAASLWQWLRGRRAYFDNAFEVQARAVAIQAEAASSRRAMPSSAAVDETIANVGMHSR